MSLRAEIHDAIDEVTPPAQHLEQRVKAFVLDGARANKVVLRNRGRARWTMPFRGAVTLVAAALVVILIGSLILGGRLLRDLNAPPHSVSQTELMSLEARPVRFPVVPPGAVCPADPITLQQPLGIVIGNGPLYMASADTWVTTDWGRWVAVQFRYLAKDEGLVLIRPKDVQSQQTTVAFAQYPLGPSGVMATGSVLGTAAVLERNAQMRSEAVVQDPWHTKPINSQGVLPPLKVMLGLPKGGSGCVGFQFDGPGFTENFVINAQATLGR